MTAPLSPLRQPKRIRPRHRDVEDLPWPTTSDLLRAVVRCRRDRPDRAAVYQRMVVIVSSHAVERYQERVRPGLDLAGARRELETLVSFGRFGGSPDWHTNPEQDANVERWLWLGDDVALPIINGVAITAMTRVQHPAFVAGRRFTCCVDSAACS